MNQPKPNSYEIIVGPKVAVTQDKKSKSRVVSFPFDFPESPSGDIVKGAIIILRLEDEDWKPHETIKSVNISFK